MALLVAAGMVAAFHVGKVPPSIPSIRAELGASLGQAGWLLSIVNLITALGGMAIAMTADRFGHRRLVLLGTALSVAASGLGAFAGSVDALLVGRFLEGLGFIAVVVAIPTLVLRIARPADHRLAMTLWTVYMPAGAGSMMLIAAVVLPGTSWRIVWLVAAAASAADRPWHSAVASVARIFFASLSSLPARRSSRAISSSGISVKRRRKRPTSASSVLRQNCQ